MAVVGFASGMPCSCFSAGVAPDSITREGPAAAGTTGTGGAVEGAGATVVGGS